MRFLVTSSRPAPRALEIAEQLQRLGHHVALLTPQAEEARGRGLRVLASHEAITGEGGAVVACDAPALLLAAERDPGAARIMVAGDAADELPPQVPGAAQAVLVEDEGARERVAALAVPARLEVVGERPAERIVAIARDLGAPPEPGGPLAEMARLVRLVAAAEERARQADQALRARLAEIEQVTSLHVAVREAREAEAGAHVQAAREIAYYRDAMHSAEASAVAARARVEELERVGARRRRAIAALRGRVARVAPRPLVELVRARRR